MKGFFLKWFSKRVSLGAFSAAGQKEMWPAPEVIPWPASHR